ncbi:MAG TPA: hypothetical protein O0X39_03515 [Methanocorpusculum sp.]|nr:hypothetical protein [Methanocorpusculum sp.]
MNTEEKSTEKYIRLTKEELEIRNTVLTAYIHEKLKNGKRYFIAKDIAEETGINTKRIGRFMHEYPKDKTGFIIEPWGGGCHTVWKITASSEYEKRTITSGKNLQSHDMKTCEV